MNEEILVVEDQSLIALDLKDRLQSLGYRVPATADNSADAIAAADRFRPALVFMDIRLSGEPDGVQTADIIRRRFHIPVIFVTAHADRDTLRRARLAEPFGYIVKPFDRIDFRPQIEIALWKNSMEEKLRESEAWLSATFRNTADALIATDRDGNVVCLNPPAESLTGWLSQHCKGKPLTEVFQVFDEATGAPLANPFDFMREGGRGGTRRGTFSLRARSGADYEPIEAAFSPNFHEGSLFGAIVVFRGIAERRRQEEECRRLQKMDALALMAAGLGRELADSQREIDNTLAELMERAEGDTLRLFHRIPDLAAHQQSIIRQLIALGRSDIGEPSPTDLNALLNSMKPAIRTTLGPGRRLKLNLEPGLPPIRIHPEGLRGNLLGMIEKSRLAMAPGGSLEVSTSATAQADGSRQVHLVLKDTGEPISASCHSRVFEPYYHSRRKTPGPGLSLAVIYRFVLLSGGRIDVVSAPGEAAAYRLDFPAWHATDPHVANRSSAAVAV